MRIRRNAGAVSFAIVLAALALPARAQSTVEECKARIDVIQTDLDAIFNAGGIGGNNPQQTYTGLTSKLQDARTKLDRGKFTDALQKLQNFQTAVIALRDAAKSKLSAADAVFSSMATARSQSMKVSTGPLLASRCYPGPMHHAPVALSA